jgi:hypothetical protein
METIREIHRVLKPGGRLRIAYEDLDRYRGGREREITMGALDGERTYMILYDRHIEDEYARMYNIVFSAPVDKVRSLLEVVSDPLSADAISLPCLERAKPLIIEARACRLVHPSGCTLARLLKEAGFREVLPTHSGSRFAARLFDAWPEEDRPGDLAGLDRLLGPLVEIVVGMAAPLESNPMITAVK